MARKPRNSRKPPAARAGKSLPEVSPRDVLLAGMGAVSLGRKQAAAAVAQAPERVAGLRNAARRAIGKARKSVAGRIVAWREQAAPVQAALVRLARDARRQLEARLAPAQRKRPARATVRRPAAKPPARRRKAA